MILTAVVFLLITPIAISSAMIAESVDVGVSPGTAIISRPTEQMLVMASSFSRVRAPASTASIMPASSLTGMKAPLRPPTEEDAIAPPFFTASFRRASAAVVPWVPQRSSPIASRMVATLSPIAGVGARERSRIPNSIPSLRETSFPIISPIRVILKVVFLIVSEISVRFGFSSSRMAAFTTPGPLTPTLITHSGSPIP